MAIYVSPGAYVREIDLSLYVPAISTTILGVIGTASKGELNEAIFVSSQADYVRKLGNPHPNHMMSYSSMQYLRRGTKLWVVRVGTADAEAAAADLIGGPTEAETQGAPNPWTFASPSRGTIISGLGGPWTFSSDVLAITTKNASNVSQYIGDDGATPPVAIQRVDVALDGVLTPANVRDAVVDAANFAEAITENGQNWAITSGADRIKVTVADPGGGAGGTYEHQITGHTDSAATALQVANSINGDTGGLGSIAIADVYPTNKIRLRSRAGGTGVTIKFIAPSVDDATAVLFGTGVTLDVAIPAVERIRAEVVNLTENPTQVVTSGPLLTSGFLRLINQQYTGALSGIAIHDNTTSPYDQGTPGSYQDVAGSPDFQTIATGLSAGQLTPGTDGTNKLAIVVGDEASGGYPGDNVTETFELSAGAGVTAEQVRQTLGNATNQPKLDSLGCTVYVTSDNRIVFRRSYLPGDPETELTPSATTFIEADDTLTTVRTAGGGGNDSPMWSDFDRHYGSAGGDTTGTVAASSPGTWGNDLKVIVTDGSEEGTFKFTVWRKHPVTALYVIEETIDNLDANPVADRYFVDVINDELSGSEYLSVTDTGSNTRPGGTFTLVNGHDGDGSDDGRAGLYAGGGGSPIALADSVYIGTNPAPTGMQIFKSAELLDVNLLSCPGVSSAPVINAMIVVCEDRGDAMCLVDPPMGLSVQQVVDWHNGIAPYDDHAAFNSSYAALYWPWLVIYDPYNAQNVTTPPSGHAAGVIAYTDYIRQLWFAPAGLQRALLPSALDLETTSPSQGDRDLLYGYPNNVNPIVKFTGVGIAIYGQKTLWRQPTAVDRINVRRLLLYARKIVASTVRYLVFEPNDPPTWRAFVRLVQPWLENIRQKRGLIDFRVVCDSTTNPPDQIDQNVMVGRVYLKPTKAAEIIQVDFVLTSTGAKFDEIIY